MYRIAIQTRFSAAHQIRGYKGDCAGLHGHNYRVEIRVETEALDDLGMGIDFISLKRLTESVVRELDHRNLNELPQWAEENPTAESIARYIHDELKEKLKGSGRLSSVRVWESESSSVEYSEE